MVEYILPDCSTVISSGMSQRFLISKKRADFWCFEWNYCM